MAIYLTGSVAYDRIMNFPGKFTDNILPDQIHNLNVSFFIDRLQEKFGGNAGNIAYTLSLLGEYPTVLATVGKDFGPYQEAMEKRGLSLSGIRRLEDELTAAAYITTDQTNNQITAFHAAAMMTPCGYAFPELNPEKSIALIGPSNMDDMNAHAALYRERKVRYIYDPAQQLPVTTREQLLAAAGGAYILIGNDYEIKLITNITGKNREELAGMTEAGLVVTLGDQGSLVVAPDGTETAVKAVPNVQTADPTGAGDAFRAGLIKGLLLGDSLPDAARLGSTCAAYCVECHGTQCHFFQLEDFFRRHAATYGTPV